MNGWCLTAQTPGWDLFIRTSKGWQSEKIWTGDGRLVVWDSRKAAKREARAVQRNSRDATVAIVPQDEAEKIVIGWEMSRA